MGSKFFDLVFLAHRSRRLEWAIVIAHRPSSVHPSSSSSVRKLFTFSTSSPKPLDGIWWNLVGMKYSWSLTSVVVFRPDLPRGGSRASQNRSRGVPFFKKTFYLIVQGFHRTYATGAACQQRTLTPPDTWSCPTLGLACVLMSRPISPELVLSPDFWISNTPRYFSFASSDQNG